MLKIALTIRFSNAHVSGGFPDNFYDDRHRNRLLEIGLKGDRWCCALLAGSNKVLATFLLQKKK